MKSTFIKHKNHVDVCCFVYSLNKYPGSTYYKGHIDWWNLGAVNSYQLGISQNIKIEESEIADWLMCEPNGDEEDNLRKMNWVPLKLP